MCGKKLDSERLLSTLQRKKERVADVDTIIWRERSSLRVPRTARMTERKLANIWNE